MRKFNREGIALILSYLVLVVVMILAAVLIQRALSEFNLAKRNKIMAEGLYLAEGALEQAAYTLSDRVANYQNPPDTFSDSVSLSSDFSINYTWTALETEHSVTSPLGLTTIVRKYHIRATATDNSYAMAVTVNEIIALKKTYTFQHAVFYNDDLEMLPGPNMTLSGKIHGNKDIYIGTHNTFTVDSDYLYSAGSIYNRRKDSSDVMEGTVRIKRNDTSDYYAMTLGGESDALDCERSDWTDESQNRWNGTAKSSVHGVTALVAPRVGSIAPGGFYATNADLRIVDSTAYNASGAQVILPPGTISASTVYNQREAKWVTVTNIDVAILNTSPYYPSNGLLYVTRTDASSATPNGIRLKSAGELAGSLTVVSNDPVYIQGDYNNTNKKAAAVISDSLDILSNNWNDANSALGLSSRIASPTTVNAAFIAGVDNTTFGHYNGGLENYPRLLENWTGKTLRIRGSFVELWNSSISQGGWIYGSPQYTAPNRDWNYDTDFNDSSKLPPFTPFAVETERVVWWRN
jgi:type II secretory pathway pseudopilin PulG